VTSPQRLRRHAIGCLVQGAVLEDLKRIVVEPPFRNELEPYCADLLIRCASDVRFYVHTVNQFHLSGGSAPPRAKCYMRFYQPQRL